MEEEMNNRINQINENIYARTEFDLADSKCIRFIEMTNAQFRYNGLSDWIPSMLTPTHSWILSEMNRKWQLVWRWYFV